MTVFNMSSKMKQANSGFIFHSRNGFCNSSYPIVFTRVSTYGTGRDLPHIPPSENFFSDFSKIHVTPKNQARICVDGSVVNGNPGDGEYRGVCEITRREVFRVKLDVPVTNNIVEWLAICQAAKMLVAINVKKSIIYSDSMVCINWYHERTVKTNMAEKYPTLWTQKLADIIAENLQFLKDNFEKLPEIRFWNKKLFDEENPADFGRK